MVKLILFVVGLVVGFGGGVYWAHKNPEQAAQISAEEERRFLEAQLAITQRIQAKLDQLAGATSGRSPTGTSGLLSQGQAAAATEVNELKAESRKQEDELRKRIDALK